MFPRSTLGVVDVRVIFQYETLTQHSRGMFPLSAFYLTAERREAQGRKPEGSVLTLRKENGVVWVFVYLPQLKWIPTVLLSGKRVTSGRSRLLEDEGTFYI